MERIGRHRITQRLGAGSFATVWRARDEALEVDVAIKVLDRRWVDDAEARQLFVAEARLLRRLDDEQFVRVHDIGTTDDGRPYFVMDLADAGSFDDLRRNRLAPGHALRLCAEAARGLELLHRQGLVHRDVSPGNILLKQTPVGLRVLLADLGVAASRSTGRDGVTAGTPAYMAPEQARGEALDHRSDIYSMAAVTHALLTGEAPFAGTTLAEVAARDAALGPAPLTARLGTPAALDALLTRALSSDPAHRPGSALELADELDAIADQLPGSQAHRPRPLGAPTAATDDETATPRRTAQPIAHPNETPRSMLQNYLPPGSYQLEPARERRSAGWLLWWSLVMLALFGLSWWLAAGWFAR